jgi:GMP synthase PP-ATPase subunit
MRGSTQMKRETGEKIVAAMTGVDVALERLLDALREIEDEEERKKIIRSYFELVDDAHVNITMIVVKQFPDLLKWPSDLGPPG